MTTIPARFEWRSDTAANWTSINPVPLPIEPCFESDTKKLKVGDGTTAWNSLPYFTGAGVASFNTRTGAVTLISGDVTGALGFTPVSTTNIKTVSGASLIGTGDVGTIGVAFGGTGATTLTGYVKGAGTSAFTAASTIPTTDLAGTLAAAQFPALTGDVTTSSGALAATIAVGAVTLAKMANVATGTVFYRKTAGTGAPEVQTLATLKTDLALAAVATSGAYADLTGQPITLIAQSAVASTITGTTTETTLATITIPANAMGANGRIEVDALWSYTNSANNKTLRQKFGGTSFLNTIVGASLATRTSAIVANRGATNSQIATPNFSTSFGVSSAAVLSLAINTTAAVTILLTAQLTNSGETITLEAYSVRLIK